MMATHIFTPLNEELLDFEEFGEKLVPYQPGLPMASQCIPATGISSQSRSSSNSSPGSSPSSAAFPAFSSST